MKVLIGCECSQVICSAFRAFGHDAYSCDLVPAYGPLTEYHIIGDVRDVYDSFKPDLFICHPPCTYLSKAGARFAFPGGILDEERYKKGLESADLFYWALSRDAPFVCVENPIPMKHLISVPYDQIIEPYFFGEPYSKATCLWLRGLPFLESTERVKSIGSWTDLHKSPKIRSQSFSGIAAAMAEQWSDLFPIRGFL